MRSPMKMEAEMGGRGPQALGPLEPQSWRRQEGPYPGASGGTSALRHLDLRCLVFRTGEGWTPVVLTHPDCDHLLENPQSSHIDPAL